MTASLLGNELLRQHAELRQMIEKAREVARRAQEDESAREQLRATVLKFDEALSVHNQYEETLLSAVAGGGWAGVDTEGMNQRHFQEHKALHAALVEVSVSPDVRWVARHLVAALDTILEHMACEERTLDQGLLADEPDTEPYGNHALGS